MIDVRPVGYLIGWLVTALGASMALPMAADLVTGDGNAQVFATTAILTGLVGVLMALACSRRDRTPLTRQQGFLLTTGIWVIFPLFGALPFCLGAPRASFTDAMFEAMSAITTTGSTVFVGLDRLPAGVLLWRGMLQWFGGLGIVVVAMIFLPTLKVGGMQLFRSEAFDTLGKILPRAGEIALRLTSIYLTLSVLCFLGYVLAGMQSFDAAVHAMTTVSTGGMANTDASFIVYGPMAHYVAIVFMILAALPFIRFVQLASGSARPLWHDSQVRTFLVVIAVTVGALSAWLLLVERLPAEPTLREVLFNIVSVITGTGFTSTDYNAWGTLAMTTFFVVGLVGGCSGSTVCSVKIFRYQLLFSAISAQVNHLHSPSRVFTAALRGPRRRPRRHGLGDRLLHALLPDAGGQRAAAGHDRSRADHRDHRRRHRARQHRPGARPGDRPGRQLRRPARRGQVGAHRHHAAGAAGDHLGAGDLHLRLLARLSD